MKYNMKIHETSWNNSIRIVILLTSDIATSCKTNFPDDDAQLDMTYSLQSIKFLGVERLGPAKPQPP